jgi:hypothetical protein
MKLASENLFIVRTDAIGRANQHRGLPNLNGMPHSKVTRVFNIRRPAGRLTARWHVCPETHRLECLWSYEAAPSDDQLWRYPQRPTQRRRYGQMLWRHHLMHPCRVNRSLLSQIRNGLL